MHDFMFSKFSIKVNTYTGVLYYVLTFDQILLKYILKTGENPITERAIQMFISMKICNDINARFHVFKVLLHMCLFLTR